LAGNKFPESLLYPDDLPYPRFPVKPLTFNDHYRGGEDEDYLLDLHAHQVGRPLGHVCGQAGAGHTQMHHSTSGVLVVVGCWMSHMCLGVYLTR
jgi:hypothetical protein